jgi:hypothetical protein
MDVRSPETSTASGYSVRIPDSRIAPLFKWLLRFHRDEQLTIEALRAGLSVCSSRMSSPLACPAWHKILFFGRHTKHLFGGGLGSPCSSARNLFKVTTSETSSALHATITLSKRAVCSLGPLPDIRHERIPSRTRSCLNANRSVPLARSRVWGYGDSCGRHRAGAVQLPGSKG